jgi:hypothetical protein
MQTKLLRKTILAGCFLFLVIVRAEAQAKDTAISALPDYDVLFEDFKSFIDSLTAPRSFTTINIGASQGHFQYQTSRNSIEEKKRLLLTPTAGYYNKNGLGASVVGSVINESGTFTLYQTAATASYDYLKNPKLLTGISFTHFFTKKALPFYTSPLGNEVNAYITYRGWWLRPALAAGYGWGSLTSVEERKEKIKLQKKGPPSNIITTTESTEQIADLMLTASVKHDFYWRNVLSKKDYFRVTPQIALTGGTQKFGLAQTNSLYVSEKHSNTSILYNTERNFISARSQFQVVALSGRIRTEFSKGIFFVQPQLLLDYYFPEKEAGVRPSFVLNAGILF